MTTLIGTSNADTMLGGAGDDTFYASAGNDRIWGGTGGFDSLILTGKFSDYTIANNGDGSYTITDTRADGDGIDVVRAIDSFTFTDRKVSLTELLNQGAYVKTGTSGDDTLLGGTNNDVITGGAGNDHIWGGVGGYDTAVYSGLVSDYSIRANNDGSFVITDKRGIDGVDIVRDIDAFRFADATLDLASFLERMPNQSRGTDGNDNQIGTLGNDHFFSSRGNDHIWGGGQGDDLLTYSGRFSDYVIIDNRDGSYTVIDRRDGSPDGTDRVRDISTFQFADRNATLKEFVGAHPGHIILDGIGTAGDDIMHGTAGDDVMFGNGGLDRIWGGSGGNDTVVFQGSFADYVVTDNANGSYTVLDTRPGSPDSIAVVRDIETYQFADRSIALGDLLTESQHLANHIQGTAASEIISGAHTLGLFGAHTNDVIVGGPGSDVIRGGSGHDLIIGDQDAVAANDVTMAAGSTSSLPTFSDSSFYQVREGQLFRVDPTTGQSEPIGNDHHNYDAVGINPHDGYAYAIGHTGPWTGHLLRIGSDGNVESLGSGYQTSKAGDFGPDGKLYIRTRTKELTVIDLADGEQTQLSFGGETPSDVHDIVYVENENGGTFYGVTVNGILVAYDLETMSIWTASISGALVGSGAYGSGWVAEDDGLYFMHEGTGNIYGISGIENKNPVATLLSVGAKSNSSDGFSTGGYGLPQYLLEDGGDTLIGGAGNDTLRGGGGTNFLDGGDGADRLEGGPGIDWADYSRATEGVHADLALGGRWGEAEGDTYYDIENIVGSSYDDVLIGDGQDNLLEGRDGDDTLRGGYGDDVLRGGNGADALDGGDGFDTATYFHAETGVAVDLELGQGLAGEAAGDTLISIESIQGSNIGNDTLLGSSGSDNLYGFGGDDWIDGRDGADVLHGGDGNDTLLGGAGNDLLLGQDGNDVLDGGEGDDTIQGGAGADFLFGGIGSDRLFGGEGNDTLHGGAGDDFLRGGHGNDVFVFDPAAGHDTILDFEAGFDTIDLRQANGFTGEGEITLSRINESSYEVAYHHQETEMHITVYLSSPGALSMQDFLV